VCVWRVIEIGAVVEISHIVSLNDPHPAKSYWLMKPFSY
jgi:hypothetical protein